MSCAFWGSDPRLNISSLRSMVPRCSVGEPLPTELGALCFCLPSCLRMFQKLRLRIITVDPMRVSY